TSYLVLVTCWSNEQRRRYVETFGQLTDMRLAQLAIALEDHGCGALTADQLAEVNRAQIVGIHQVAQSRQRGDLASGPAIALEFLDKAGKGLKIVGFACVELIAAASELADNPK